MPVVTMTSKNQITLPIEIARQLNVKPGDKLVVELVQDHVVLMPQPGSWADYVVGSVKGVYGARKEDIDSYINEVRYGDVAEEDEELLGVLNLDEELRAVYEAVSSREMSTLSQISESSGVYLAQQKLERLEGLKAIERWENPAHESETYYRRAGG